MTPWPLWVRLLLWGAAMPIVYVGLLAMGFPLPVPGGTP